MATVHAHVRTLNSSTQEYNYYPIDQLSDLLAENPGLEFEAVNCDFQRINDILSSAGRKMISGEEYQEPDEIQDSQRVQLVVNVDSRYKRTIAKIAFNYLAYNLNSIDSTLVLKDDFHNVRNFIRYGEEPEDSIVDTQNDKFLATTGGHLIDVALKRHGLRRMIVARVCLFNLILWTVLLTKNYKGIDFALMFKHAWDLNARICKQIHG